MTLTAMRLKAMQRLDARALRLLLASTALGTSLAIAAHSAAWAQATQDAPPAPQTEATTPAPVEKSEMPAAAPMAAPAATPAPQPQAEARTEAAPAVSDAVLDEVRKLASSSGSDTAALTAFYANRSAPLWVTDAGFNARADHAMAVIAKADDWGLVASQFELPKLAPGADARARAMAEIRLSSAVLKYARHARGGRIDPLSLSPNLDQKLALRDPAEVMKAVSETDQPGAYLLLLHPQHEQFKKLQAALAKARAGDATPEPAQPDFVVMPADGPQLKSGSKHAQVPMLRKRLGLDARPDDTLFDAELSEALKTFQRDKGLPINGQLTPKTRQALNAGAPKPAVKPAAQIPKIIANMERWRWMPENMGAFHVWQNTPEYTARVVKNGEVVHQMRVVVGKTNTQTPVFSARMQYVVFNPEWGVPDSIKVKEILPYLKPSQDDFFGQIFGGGGFGGADTRVLQKHNLRVSLNGKPVDAANVNWSQADIRRYTFIQPAGGTNVLGVVKFRFPNKHDVYMHDTPQRDLFGREVRAFSHGCVRVQNPLKLAEVLLAEDKGWTEAQIKQAVAGPGPNEVELTNRIPVHLSYFTAVAGDEGQLRFYDDLYGHDARVTAALAGRSLPPDVVADASEPAPTKGKKGKRKPITDDLW
jgi:murein L,D-transpeptidase YcbB/YkuD